MFWWFQKPVRVVFRPLPSESALHCAGLHAPAFAHPWAVADFEQLLSADNIVADGAFEGPGERLAGMVLSRVAAEEAEILTIAVSAARRRNGIAKALMGAHLGRLSSVGIKALFLEVATDNNAALALYEGFGFRKVGERKGYYRNANGSAIAARILRRDLA
jgi:[ribosomal protein S18]-alanine N-acetyltransferase